MDCDQEKEGDDEMIPALLSIGFITLLLFLPLMCYWDIRDRKVPWEYFAVLAALNIPATAYLYYTGTLSLWHLAYSLAVCIFAFAVWKIYGAGFPMKLTAWL